MTHIVISAHLRNMDEIQGALDALTAINMGQLSGGIGLQSLNGIRYRREVSGAETWQSIRDLMRNRHGDCEDLACAQAAIMRNNGVKARAVCLDVRGQLHAVVRMPDGRIIDPSARNGMLDMEVSGMENDNVIDAEIIEDSTPEAPQPPRVPSRRARRRARMKRAFRRVARKAIALAKQYAGTPEGRTAIATAVRATRRAIEASR